MKLSTLTLSLALALGGLAASSVALAQAYQFRLPLNSPSAVTPPGGSGGEDEDEDEEEPTPPTPPTAPDLVFVALNPTVSGTASRSVDYFQLTSINRPSFSSGDVSLSGLPQGWSASAATCETTADLPQPGDTTTTCAGSGTYSPSGLPAGTHSVTADVHILGELAGTVPLSYTVPLNGSWTWASVPTGSPPIINVQLTPMPQPAATGTKSMQFTNTSNGPLANPVWGVQVLPANFQSMFAVTHNCPNPVPAGASCTVNLYFSPNRTAVPNASATVSLNATGALSTGSVSPRPAFTVTARSYN